MHGLLSKPEGIIVGVVYLVEADPIKRMHDICRRQITSHQKDEGYSYGNFIRIGNHIATGGDLETNIEVLYIVCISFLLRIWVPTLIHMPAEHTNIYVRMYCTNLLENYITHILLPFFC